MTTTGRPRS